MQSNQLYWLAGILEGEGSFSVRKDNNSPRLDMGSTDLDVVSQCAILMGTRIYGPYGPAKGGRKPYFRIFLHGARAIQWMMTLFSLMGYRRREQIKKAIEAWRSNERA